MNWGTFLVTLGLRGPKTGPTSAINVYIDCACWAGLFIGSLLIKIDKNELGNIPGYFRSSRTEDWPNKCYQCILFLLVGGTSECTGLLPIWKY